jgi:hypothetical protein
MLDGRLGETLQRVLDEGRDVNCLHEREITCAAAFTPVREPARRRIVCAPGVPVTDVGGEELPEAFRRPGLRQEQQRPLSVCSTCGTAIGFWDAMSEKRKKKVVNLVASSEPSAERQESLAECEKQNQVSQKDDRGGTIDRPARRCIGTSHRPEITCA